ncbi:MAG TPA: RNA methyltransferase [Casimicrobiaceae bacterium]|nr:RNA methyltransferase [Casimicrobiaceae bacterium]
MPRITSRDNPRLREAAQLIASSRERRKAQRCVLEGEHLVAAYRRRIGPPETLIVAETARERPAVRSLLSDAAPSRTLIVGSAAWASLGSVPGAAGVLAVVPTPRPRASTAADFCLLLDDVQDPGNVGSSLRSAAAAGVAQVFLAPGCAFAWSPKVLRAAQGAHFHLDIHEDVDLAAWARAYRGRVIATAGAAGESLYDADLTGAVAIAIGNEGAGVSEELRAAASATVAIPMPGRFESLNAAAAAAVCLFECVRQRDCRRA